jgi:lysophospholipase L1-like esterase
MAVLATSAALAEAKPPRCVVHRDLARLDYPLARTNQRIAAAQPLKIVAIGSSSTEGAGASSPAKTYPNRLADELRQRFQAQSVTVLNHGVGGEDAREMLARFETGVFKEQPDLVLWQVGTNSVLNDRPLPPASRRINRGVRSLRDRGIDVVLIDPQFAPKVIAKPEAPAMVKLLAEVAKDLHVGVFRRFDLMRRWKQEEGIAFSTFLSKDELHMNDWSYACVGKVLAAAIAEAATRPPAAVSAQRAR